MTAPGPALEVTPADLLQMADQVTDTADEALLNELFAEMQRLNEKMRQDQADIDRLKAETRAIAAHSDQILRQVEAQLDILERQRN